MSQQIVKCPGRYRIEVQDPLGQWLYAELHGLKMRDKHQYPEDAEKWVAIGKDPNNGEPALCIHEWPIRIRVEVPAKLRVGTDEEFRIVSYSEEYVDEEQPHDFAPLCGACEEPLPWEEAHRVAHRDCLHQEEGELTHPDEVMELAGQTVGPPAEAADEEGLWEE